MPRLAHDTVSNVPPARIPHDKFALQPEPELESRTACRGPLYVVAHGCASYQYGQSARFPRDVQTVYVPMIESDSFRRFLGERLTEAVCKQIEIDTPYKVVNDPNADTVLYVRLLTTPSGCWSTTSGDVRDSELIFRSM